jgi:hypothetical protein
MPANARRCPHCGDFQKMDSRRLTLYLSVLGILGVLAIVALGLFLKPTVVDTGNTPQSERQQTDPPKPVKKPPLD